MATRSRIGIELSDGSVLSAYHHWDGYPEWLGRILRTQYNTKEKVAELIDGGDMSSCWTNAGWKNETLPTTGPLYYSSRGEDVPPRLDKNLGDYLKVQKSLDMFILNKENGCAMIPVTGTIHTLKHKKFRMEHW